MKGSTNALRGEFGKVMVVRVDNTSLPTLSIKVINTSSSTKNYTTYSGSLKNDIVLLPDDRLCVLSRYTYSSTGTSNPYYEHINSRLVQTSINLDGIISTNLPAGSTLNINVYKRTGGAASRLGTSVLFTLEGTVRDDGGVDVSDLPDTFTLYDSLADKNTRNIDVAYYASIKQIGGGGTN